MITRRALFGSILASLAGAKMVSAAPKPHFVTGMTAELRGGVREPFGLTQTEYSELYMSGSRAGKTSAMWEDIRQWAQRCPNQPQKFLVFSWDTTFNNQRRLGHYEVTWVPSEKNS